MTELFDDYEILLQKFKKSEYIKNMDVYRNKYEEQLKTLIDAASDVNDPDASKDKYIEFSKQICKKYSFLNRLGKLKKQDLSLFMIYFIFPAMLLTGKDNDCDERSKEACDRLLKAWNDTLGVNIDYVDYNNILAGFNDKMFGIF